MISTNRGALCIVGGFLTHLVQGAFYCKLIRSNLDSMGKYKHVHKFILSIQWISYNSD